MSGFISSPAPAASPPGETLDFGAFWPEIDINHFRDSQRIGGTLIPPARVKTALINAVMTVEDDLAVWLATQRAAGYTMLADVPATQIADESRLVLRWRQAVYGIATADLAETHADVTVTGTGQARAGELDWRADDHRRNALQAIRAIKGKDRTTVELI
ncbi:MAG: head completion/stabilization protein [Sphingobium sp.]|nr:head completion/stabilization protein [Sphingobium sp.]